MSLKLPQRDPAAAHGRKVRAARRVGAGAQCACGEKRPEALIPGSMPMTCAQCKRIREEKSPEDKHHIYGKANSLATIPFPVNDHRADLSVAQQDWPRETLQNPNGSPLLAGAAFLRGNAETVTYLQSRLLPVAEMLEDLDSSLKQKYGPDWWIGTPLEKFTPERKAMKNLSITSLPIAVRVYPVPPIAERKSRSERPWKIPDAMLVFDTETRTNASQGMTFGSYRYFVEQQCVEEGLFYADDLPEEDRRILEKYVATHNADVADGGRPELRLLGRREFANLLFRYGYRDRCLVVGFNLPFDLSRIAFDSASARGRFAGGFSLGLCTYVGKDGRELLNPNRSRIGIKQIDSKRALKGFTGRRKPDRIDLIPEGSPTGEPEQGYIFRGHFLDPRTLAFALTDIGYSLETGCENFGVEHGKQHVVKHGVVTEEYIDYNRRDVLATAELAFKLLEEYAKHPIALQATKAYSPASIGKAYLRAMGIKPILERQPDFPKEFLGYAQSAFFGGRTSAHIRKIVVPVVHTDFLSMYPTVNSLMGLWDFVTAEEIVVVEHCQEEIEAFLRNLTADDLFKPETWKYLTAFVKMIPDGDILPTRGKYAVESNDWQVGVNHLNSASENPSDGLWFALPDVVASVILTNRMPKIVDAFRIKTKSKLKGLKPIKLRGAVEVDPTKQDFFKVVIEERRRLPLRTDLSPAKRKRLEKALKVLANAASYGIYAEMNRQESEENVEVICHGIDTESFTCRVSHPDVPGEYCFPPLASLITGAARLMLALLEHTISKLGGSYAMEDTDSMAIVATKDGGLIECPGGPNRTESGREAIKAFSWEQVRAISQRFATLNSYDRQSVPGSILKIEDDNFDPSTGEQRQLYCFAISAKRYVLFQPHRRNWELIAAILGKLGIV